MNKGFITINRKGIIEEDYIKLQLKDAESRNRFVEVRIPLDEFMRAMTGVAERPMEYEINNKVLGTLGRTRVVQRVNMDLPLDFSYDRNKIEELVIRNFNERAFYKNGWFLKDYGTNTQQNNTFINGHRIWTYKIERYVDESETVE